MYSTTIPSLYYAITSFTVLEFENAKSITILYFGDCDSKGKVIPFSAIKDVQKRMGTYQSRFQLPLVNIQKMLDELRVT